MGVRIEASRVTQMANWVEELHRVSKERGPEFHERRGRAPRATRASSTSDEGELFEEPQPSQEANSLLLSSSSSPPLRPIHGGYHKIRDSEGKAKKAVQAQNLWFEILKSQIETGTPYMLFKDTCNRKSNQQNLGTIKSSNLCTEIIEYTSPEETAVCNLASIALPRFVREKAIPIESHPSKLVGIRVLRTDTLTLRS